MTGGNRPGTVDLGEAVTRRVLITTSAGVAVAADSLPTYAITQPDGSAGTPPTVTAGVTGEYFVTYTPTMAGPHADVFSATVAGALVKFGPDVFNVRAALPGALLGLAEARQLLGLGTDTQRDEQLREYLEAATELCEDYTGQSYRRRTCTETYDGGKTAIRLRVPPAQAITSASESGTVLPASGYVLDANSGLLYRGSTAGALVWQSGVQNITVVYTTGATQASARIRQAVRVTLIHLWHQQGGASGGPRRALGSNVDDQSTTNGMAWALPRAAEELLAPDMMAGFS